MITGDLFYGMTYDAQRQLTIRAHQAKGILTPAAHTGLTTDKIADAPLLKAYVNHGRWVVDCECGGAEFAWDNGLFMCNSCLNAKHSNQLRRVIFPRNRSKIEFVLMVRPEVNRNWYVGEKVAKLEAENKAHKEVL